MRKGRETAVELGFFSYFFLLRGGCSWQDNINKGSGYVLYSIIGKNNVLWPAPLLMMIFSETARNYSFLLKELLVNAPKFRPPPLG